MSAEQSELRASTSGGAVCPRVDAVTGPTTLFAYCGASRLRLLEKGEGEMAMSMHD